jgi:hypothetical protein
MHDRETKHLDAADGSTAAHIKQRVRTWLSPAAALLCAMGCSDEPSATSTSSPLGAGIPLPSGSVYTTIAQVETPEGSTTAIAFTPELPTGELDVQNALEVTGFAQVKSYAGSLFIGDSEALTVTRYDVAGDRLVASGTLGLQNRGVTTLSELYFTSPDRAFVVNSDQYEIVEWDPSTMQVTNSYDISALAREGWGYEYRRGYLRAADGVLFFIWAYTNDRQEFINDFVVGVFDTVSGSFDVIVDDACPASAGFGGFFDEVGDLYLPADSFGGFTFFDGTEPKEPCIRRIRSGERQLDTTYAVRPMQALGGLAPWGLYYAGNGTAYTTAVDPAKLPGYESVFAFIFDTIHEGYALDLALGTSERIEEMPPDAVGFESVTIDGQVLIPRSAGSVRIYDVDNVRTRVYTLDSLTKVATERFTLPGYLGSIEKLR